VEQNSDGFESYCSNRFKQDCTAWLDGQGDVDQSRRYLVKEGDPMPSDLNGCTDVRLLRAGHGLGCQNYTQLIQACLQQCGSGLQSADCEDDGCEVFQNTAEVAGWMVALQSTLTKTQTLQVTGAQNVQGGGCTASKVTYKVNAKVVSRSCAACNPSGNFCYASGSEPFECSGKGNGECDTQQYCCATGLAKLVRGNLPPALSMRLRECLAGTLLMNRRVGLHTVLCMFVGVSVVVFMRHPGTFSRPSLRKPKLHVRPFLGLAKPRR